MNDVSPSEEPVAIAILDAGSQYGKVIDRRLREQQVNY
jgi:GMP synthase-like glutamine amidotransferase